MSHFSSVGGRALEGLVDLPPHRLPLPLATGDLVELLLHLRREADVYDLREVADEEVVDHHPQVLGLEIAAVPLDVAALLDRGEDGGVGAGPPDAVLPHPFAQG